MLVSGSGEHLLQARDPSGRMFVALLPLWSSALSARIPTIESATTKTKVKLGLLPFSIEDALLPGEARDVFLFDEHLRKCVDAASPHNALAGVLVDSSGGYCNVANVLEIQQIRSDMFCTWVRLRCVSRVEVSSVLRNKKHGFRVITGDMYTDTGPSSSEELISSLEAVRELHAEVASQRRALHAALSIGFDTGPHLAAAGDKGNAAASSAEQSIHVSPDRVHAPFGVFLAGGEEDEELWEDE